MLETAWESRWLPDLWAVSYTHLYYFDEEPDEEPQKEYPKAPKNEPQEKPVKKKYESDIEIIDLNDL